MTWLRLEIWNILPPTVQGCESEITSMVTEARRKSSKCLDAAMLALGHLAAITGTPLNAMERGVQATGKVTPALIPQQLLSVPKPWGLLESSLHAPLLENGILPVWQKLVWNYWLEQGCNVFDLLMCVGRGKCKTAFKWHSHIFQSTRHFMHMKLEL